MKNKFILLLLLLSIAACKPKPATPAEPTPSETPVVDNPPVLEDPVVDPPAETDPKVNIPSPTADWIEVKLNQISPKMVISTPKGVKVEHGADYISVDLDENANMYIQPEPIDMADEKAWYRETESRENLSWLIDSDTEALYTGTDLSAPKGHQTTNSFFASRKIGQKWFSTNVDGIIINSDTDIYNLSMANCQLLLGIFRTLKLQ